LIRFENLADIGGNVLGRDVHGSFFEMVVLRLLHLAGKLVGL